MNWLFQQENSAGVLLAETKPIFIAKILDTLFAHSSASRSMLT
jgi:hypothetical protein